jgi:hypothetical protein
VTVSFVCSVIIEVSSIKQGLRGWRNLYEEVYNLYSSLTVVMRMSRSRMIRWAGHIARSGELKNMYIFVGKSTGKTPLGIRGFRPKDTANIVGGGGGYQSVFQKYVAWFAVRHCRRSGTNSLKLVI